MDDAQAPAGFGPRPAGTPTARTAPAGVVARIREAVGSVVVGNGQALDLLVVALLCRGHALVEDVPGVGKTLLARSFARVLGCEFTRVQLTPDVLPSDVTGSSVFNQATAAFEFRPGPIFTQVLLADEVNRATPRAQSALLEAMEERQVTVDGETRPLPEPFLVLATQNPVEYEGTFPLPEAQLDRFGLKLSLGYPGRDEEIALLDRFLEQEPLEDMAQVCTVDDIRAAQETCRGVFMERSVKQYAVDLCAGIRRHAEVALGASPRATLALGALAQARAALAGRGYVLPDDIKALAPWTLPHRVVLAAAARWREQTAEAVVAAVLRSVAVPAAARRG